MKHRSFYGKCIYRQKKKYTLASTVSKKRKNKLLFSKTNHRDSGNSHILDWQRWVETSLNHLNNAGRSLDSHFEVIFKVLSKKSKLQGVVEVALWPWHILLSCPHVLETVRDRTRRVAKKVKRMAAVSLGEYKCALMHTRSVLGFFSPYRSIP